MSWQDSSYIVSLAQIRAFGAPKQQHNLLPIWRMSFFNTVVSGTSVSHCCWTQEKNHCYISHLCLIRMLLHTQMCGLSFRIKQKILIMSLRGYIYQSIEIITPWEEVKWDPFNICLVLGIEYILINTTPLWVPRLNTDFNKDFNSSYHGHKWFRFHCLINLVFLSKIKKLN